MALKQIDFKELPHNIQIEIIKTLFSYSECHIEHEHGRMEVTTSHCIRANYPDDFWVSQDFTKKSLHMYCVIDANEEWYKMTQDWEHMTNEEKDILIKAQSIMLNHRAELAIKHYIYMEER